MVDHGLALFFLIKGIKHADEELDCGVLRATQGLAIA